MSKDEPSGTIPVYALELEACAKVLSDLRGSFRLSEERFWALARRARDGELLPMPTVATQVRAQADRLSDRAGMLHDAARRLQPRPAVAAPPPAPAPGSGPPRGRR